MWMIVFGAIILYAILFTLGLMLFKGSRMKDEDEEDNRR